MGGFGLYVRVERRVTGLCVWQSVCMCTHECVNVDRQAKHLSNLTCLVEVVLALPDAVLLLEALEPLHGGGGVDALHLCCGA